MWKVRMWSESVQRSTHTSEFIITDNSHRALKCGKEFCVLHFGESCVKEEDGLTLEMHRTAGC